MMSVREVEEERGGVIVLSSLVCRFPFVPWLKSVLNF